MTALKLGLIGDNIAKSSAPRLHRLAGAQNGVEVTYDRLVPAQIGEPFDALFANCAPRGYRGINVTYPYKERAAEKVSIADPLVRAMGAVNTVLFEPEGPQGHNTDYTGFIAAYRVARGAEGPGLACLVGAGGVGRALAFALVTLGAEEIRLCDRDTAKAEALAADLGALPGAPRLVVEPDARRASAGATGLLNGTPLGMDGIGGNAFPEGATGGAKWVFDAVYTPVETPFITEARAGGLQVISGYELFFWQGVHAWGHFSGTPLDEPALRRALAAG
ncbi:shikimate dehydrogenase family protein [Vannielia litorea]|uniref:Shikimate dehydrogenase n=1 Tax=Vannielia litorea TaxID=1217970 RepID=A0A1N6IGL9_9RHOB|nr:shikimate dehydrogenase [Vannielia litorea]SIO31105.1 shikimate dehydrogenase [Vannielia litorea]